MIRDLILLGTGAVLGIIAFVVFVNIYLHYLGGITLEPNDEKIDI